MKQTATPLQLLQSILVCAHCIVNSHQYLYITSSLYGYYIKATVYREKRILFGKKNQTLNEYNFQWRIKKKSK